MSKGRNVWYELLTTDVEAAKRFYGEVIGWKAATWPDADPSMPPYFIWTLGETGIGGVMTLPEEARKMGAPSHWLAYTGVDDVDRSVAEATGLGGKVLQPPMDIPKVGRVAILADPQGAVFAIYKSASEWTPPTAGDQVGHFSWAELNTTDWEAAWRFYGQLFGWKERSKMDMGPGGVYFMFHDASEATKGGMSNLAAQMKMPAHWLHYITVADMDATVAKVKQAGGKILNGPMPIPGDDLIAQCQDPQGAAFAIYAHGKK